MVRGLCHENGASKALETGGGFIEVLVFRLSFSWWKDPLFTVIAWFFFDELSPHDSTRAGVRENDLSGRYPWCVCCLFGDSRYHHGRVALSA